MKQLVRFHPLEGTSEVVKTSQAPLTLLDKAKGWYKDIVVAIGSILVIANELTPVFNLVVPAAEKHWVTAGIAFLTAALTFLQKNQAWVENL